MGGEAPELEENKKPRHHVEAFEVFECFSSLCFLCSYDLRFENQFSNSACKSTTNIDINQIFLDFLCKKQRKRLQFLRTKKTICALLWLKYSCAFCVF